MWKILLTISSSLSSAAPVAVEMRTEKQQLRLNCTAVREYVQLTDAPPNSALAAINAQIRREMTVGKKLGEEDCPSSGSSDSFEYHNRAVVSGQRQGLLGIEYTIFFPSGSGKFVRHCSTFQLSNGHMLRLRHCLKAAGLEEMQKAVCAEDKSCASDFQNAEFCLTNEGLQATLPAGNPAHHAQFAAAQAHKWATAECPL
jgi:hypothetical protein